MCFVKLLQLHLIERIRLVIYTVHRVATALIVPKFNVFNRSQGADKSCVVPKRIESVAYESVIAVVHVSRV